MIRLSLDDYFLKIALTVAERSTCRRHHVGAVAVRDRHLLATGYNGAVAGLKDCLELGCIRDELKVGSGERQELCRAVHAEQNVVIQAGIHAVSLKGATVYCTHAPCVLCSKVLANVGIVRLVYCFDYVGSDSTPLLESGIACVCCEPPSSVISMKR